MSKINRVEIAGNTLRLRTSNTHARPINQVDMGKKIGDLRTDTDLYVYGEKDYAKNKDKINDLLMANTYFDVSKKNENQSIKKMSNWTMDINKMLTYYNDLKIINNSNVDLWQKYIGKSILGIKIPTGKITSDVEVYFKKNNDNKPKLQIRFRPKRQSMLHNYIFSNIISGISIVVFDFKNQKVWLEAEENIENINERISKTYTQPFVYKNHLKQDIIDFKEYIDSMNGRLYKEQKYMARSSSIQKYFKDTLKLESNGIFNNLGRCSIINCKIKGDMKFLVASHIKPWNKCKDLKEAGDFNNGLLLCPNHDLLFDKGYISFSKTGLVVFFKNAKGKVNNFFDSPNPGIHEEFLTTKRIEMLDYHKNNILRKHK